MMIKHLIKKDKNLIVKFLKSDSFEYFTLFIALFGTSASYIQAYKIFSLKSAHAVSLSATLIVFFASLCWLVYGIARNIKPLIISNIVGLIGAFILIVGILYFD